MRVRLRLVSLAVLVAGGAIAAGFALWPSGKHAAAGCAGPAVTPLSPDAQKALNAYATSIRYDKQTSPGGPREDTWIDPVTGAMRILSFDAQGRLTSEEGETRSGKTERTVVVSFGTRSWISTTATMPQAYASGDEGAITDSLGVRRGLADGTTRVLGHAVIAGHNTLHLRQSVLQLWVDPLTYLPIREQAAGITTDTTWLPRTPSNLLDTSIVVPQGFTQAKTGHSTSFQMTWSAPTACGQ
jgi:hypothetical protein